MIEKDSTALKSGVSGDTIKNLPVGQEYRDLIKLIPGVMYTQDGTRGPSAGGSGQDNVYKFDGVNVTMPLYGTLSAEPASHDIEQMTTVKGGAKAVDFDRAGGFTVDSVSRSGTNRFQGDVQLPVPERLDVGGPDERQPLEVRRRTASGSRRTSAVRSGRTSSTSTPRTTARVRPR